MGNLTNVNGQFYLDGAEISATKVAVLFNTFQILIDQKNDDIKNRDGELGELKTIVTKLKRGLASHYEEQHKEALL